MKREDYEDKELKRRRTDGKPRRRSGDMILGEMTDTAVKTKYSSKIRLDSKLRKHLGYTSFTKLKKCFFPKRLSF